ncbi:hypothetical protein [Dyadobacter psychrotolerans]|uniref:Outer membrane protein beta-barrel domain-containing protein n=1 Tax=Dyadobacter psychrotolerans TaxID=2541721 RepID=A0A4R5DLP6_9BACT|nr:hypothetical protein [Dyadobacter psychrotolerans]TDE11573.1 hypothetical protein E0F88_24375 [Dyadobacter psychrotolerans]
MKKVFLLLVLFTIISREKVLAQASVGYYPWSNLLTVSTNATNAIWLDTRMQTNSLFSSLSIDILPMINLKRGEVVQWYIGGGLRLNPLYRIADAKADLITVDGYSVNVGVRISPLPQNRRIQLALELNPYVKDDFESGVLKSHFGIVYAFGKKKKSEIAQ